LLTYAIFFNLMRSLLYFYTFQPRLLKQWVSWLWKLILSIFS